MIKYTGSVSYNEVFNANCRASLLFGALQFRYDMESGSGVYLFGKKMKTSSNRKEDNAPSESDSEKKRTKLSLENIKNLIRVSKGTVIKAFKHVMPKELKGDFEFGFDDPYYTGKLLEIFALLYATMGERLKVRPIWDKVCFSGFFEVRGRICTLYLIVLAAKLWFNREFRQVWRECHGK